MTRRAASGRSELGPGIHDPRILTPGSMTQDPMTPGSHDPGPLDPMTPGSHDPRDPRIPRIPDPGQVWTWILAGTGQLCWPVLVDKLAVTARTLDQTPSGDP